MSRHLHRDYHNAECGRDASHILMTYEETEADCKKCLAGRKRRLEAEAAERERMVAEEEARIAALMAERSLELGN